MAGRFRPVLSCRYVATVVPASGRLLDPSTSIQVNMKAVVTRANTILLKVIPFVLLIVCCKLVLHTLDCEFLSINAIFSGIIGATVFLLGFLLSGVLSDFKESERLPGEMAAIVATIADELECASRRTGNVVLVSLLEDYHRLVGEILEWFRKRERTGEIMREMRSTFMRFNECEGSMPPNYIARIKQEHHALRKILVRIHAIRETSFISSGYLIATTTTCLLVFGLIVARIDPFYESLFFVGVVSYLMIFLILLIRDLDNPFGYYEKGSSEDVSLKPLQDILADVAGRIESLKGMHVDMS